MHTKNMKDIDFQFWQGLIVTIVVIHSLLSDYLQDSTDAEVNDIASNISTSFVHVADKSSHSCSTSQTLHRINFTNTFHRKFSYVCDDPYDWSRDIYTPNKTIISNTTRFLRCQGQRSCFDSTTNIASKIHCDGAQSCALSTFDGEDTIFCDGTLSCAQSILIAHHVNVDVNVNFNEHHSNSWSTFIHGRGAFSLFDAIIYVDNCHDIYNYNYNYNYSDNIDFNSNCNNSSNGSTNIILDGYKSGANLTIIIASMTTFVEIKCKNEACFDTKIICVECDYNDENKSLNNVEIKCSYQDLLSNFCPVVVFPTKDIIHELKGSFTYANINRTLMMSIVSNISHKVQSLQINKVGYNQYQAQQSGYYLFLYQLTNMVQGCADFGTGHSMDKQVEYLWNDSVIDRYTVSDFYQDEFELSNEDGDDSDGNDDNDNENWYRVVEEFKRSNHLHHLVKYVLKWKCNLDASDLTDFQLDQMVDFLLKGTDRYISNYFENHKSSTESQDYQDVDDDPSQTCNNANEKNEQQDDINATANATTETENEKYIHIGNYNTSSIKHPYVTTNFLCVEQYRMLNRLQIDVRTNNTGIICGGSESCNTKLIARIDRNQSIYCLGKSSCSLELNTKSLSRYLGYAVIMLDFENMYCAGYQACQSIYLENIHNIYFLQNRDIDPIFSNKIFKSANSKNNNNDSYPRDSEWVNKVLNKSRALIRSKLMKFESTNIHFNAHGAGYYVTLECAIGDTCNIFCNVPGSCNYYFTFILCNGTCNIYCTLTYSSDYDFEYNNNYPFDCPNYIAPTGKVHLIKKHVYRYASIASNTNYFNDSTIDISSNGNNHIDYNVLFMNNDSNWNLDVYQILEWLKFIFFFWYISGVMLNVVKFVRDEILPFVKTNRTWNPCYIISTSWISLKKQVFCKSRFIGVVNSTSKAKPRVPVVYVLQQFDNKTLRQKVTFVQKKRKYCGNPKSHKRKYYLNEDLQVCQRLFWKCSECTDVVYCSRNCQKIHWKRSHYRVCSVSQSSS